MNNKLNLRFTATLVGCLLGLGALHAQTIQLKVLSTGWEQRTDSTVLKMELQLETDDLQSFSHINVTPYLTSYNQRVALPAIRLNDKQAQKKWQREQQLARRKNKDYRPEVQAMVVEKSNQRFTYRGAIAYLRGASGMKMELQKEVFQKNGKRIQNELLSVGQSKEVRIPAASTPVAAAKPQVTVVERSTVAPATSPELTPTQEVASSRIKYRGTFITPETDATDERNQKELNFSLDEARVMAEITPQMLSLRELYAVALSYKNQPAKFYQLIQISVQIYPANPVANLNAAAAALEQGDVESAGHYLKIASHETLAYKSCRGIYELMCNNMYEGIRLLKAAKAEGSEEAAYNLNLFFESNKPADNN